MQKDVWRDAWLPNLHLLSLFDCSTSFVKHIFPQGGVQQDLIQVFPKLGIVIGIVIS